MPAGSPTATIQREGTLKIDRYPSALPQTEVRALFDLRQIGP